jgi:hypothetical protein
MLKRSTFPVYLSPFALTILYKSMLDKSRILTGDVSPPIAFSIIFCRRFWPKYPILLECPNNIDRHVLAGLVFCMFDNIFDTPRTMPIDEFLRFGISNLQIYEIPYKLSSGDSCGASISVSSSGLPSKSKTFAKGRPFCRAAICAVCMSSRNAWMGVMQLA